MKLKQIGVIGITIVLLVGGGAPNFTYAMEPQEQILNNVDYQMITPFWIGENYEEEAKFVSSSYYADGNINTVNNICQRR